MKRTPKRTTLFRPAAWSAGTLGLALALGGACKKPEQPAPAKAPDAQPVAPTPKPEVDPGRLAIFGQPLPAAYPAPHNPITDEKVALGRMLYFDTRLSKNHDVSCNTCHDLAKFGVDGRKVSLGHRQQPGKRNSPTVYNAAGHFVQFWDGRAAHVEEQASGPMMNPVEMASPGADKIEAVIRSIPQYVELFKKAFPEDKEPTNIKNMTQAIGAFERKLTTPGRFDKFLAGDKTALTDAEKIGLNRFIDTGCTACHMGALVGGTMYQKAGLIKPWPNQDDPGRAEVTKAEADRMMFKVPSLRNIAETGPYFHDGSVPKLEDAVKTMAAHQLGRDLKDDEIASIVAFLKALTGEPPKELIAAPTLPPSPKGMPKPDPT